MVTCASCAEAQKVLCEGCAGSLRFGYQGDFAEEDQETGFNHFQLRDYDPVIGRTITIDPARQFYSGYVWVGNNPVMGIDPTGGTCPTCPDDAAYDNYRNSNLDYAYSSLVGGDGAYQMLAPVTINSNPAAGGTAPSWMFYRMDMEFHFDASLQMNAGLLTYGDVGIVGASTDIVSAELMKIGLKHDFVNGKGSGGFYGDMILENGQIKLSHGGRYEAGLDGKYGVKALLDINSPSLSLQEGYIGGGAPLVEIKAVQRHTGVHSIDLGLQEDFSVGTGIGLKGNVNATFQINLSNPTRR